jgi:hypothetical protein
VQEGLLAVEEHRRPDSSINESSVILYLVPALIEAK